MKRTIRARLSALLALVLLFGGVLCPLRTVAVSDPASGAAAAPALPTALIPGGYPFGVNFTTQGVLVVGFRDITTADGKTVNPANEAGLKVKDRIVSLNGVEIDSARALADCIAASEGAPLTLTYHRGEQQQRVTLTPVMDSGGSWRTGLYVRDSGAGIGTLTYIDPTTLAFGGLGHGICDVDTGELMPVKNGNVVGVTVNAIKRGLAGNPGELRGYFHAEKLGSLRKNCMCGVFGVYSQLPSAIKQETLPVGGREAVHAGEAHILCTLSGGERRSYAVTISAVDRAAQDSKCFAIRVTDPALLEETGGIVQGMSGSPVIQDGKLVGAVTHVLINDPARGYGIFIENMLRAAG